MTKNARKLVEKLHMLQYTVHGRYFQIYRYYGQSMMNKAAGEAAPTWELLVDPLYNTITGKIVNNCMTPTVTFPDGTMIPRLEVCSHFPLMHIISQPLKEWEIDYQEEYDRLFITTKKFPPCWNV